MMLKFPFIQVAGVLSEDDLKTLIRCAVPYIGFPLVLGYHREDLPREDVARLIAEYNGQFEPVLITYLDNAEDILDLMHFIDARIVQIHGQISVEEMQKLKFSQPDFAIIKSLIIKKDNFDELEGIIQLTAPFVDAFITDTYDAASGACGATGKTHDWSVSRRIVEISPKPVILAGGLNSDNVAEAVRSVSPSGVDLHTGAEDANGFKNCSKTSEFLRKALSTFAEVNFKSCDI